MGIFFLFLDHLKLKSFYKLYLSHQYPTITPDLNEFSSLTSKPESKKASWAAIKPKVMNLSILLCSLKGTISSLISSEFIDPAIWHGYSLTSKVVIFFKPLFELINESQLLFTLLPSGLIVPRPVTTTLLNFKKYFFSLSLRLSK